MTKLIIGAMTLIAGIILVLRHLHVWRDKTDATDDVKEKRILWSQFRRRTLTSTSISVLGVVIAALYWTSAETPMRFTILISCSLVLTLMIFVLASLDFLAVSHAVRLEHLQSGEAAQELAREYHRQKKKQEESANGADQTAD